MSNPHAVKPALGMWMLTALVTGNMIGSGVFLLPSSLSTIGSIGIIGWMLTSVGAILLAMVFAQLSIWIPKVGGPYAYCYESFGEFIGFQIAYNYWIALWVGNAAIVVALVGYLSFFFPILGHSHLLDYVVGLSFLWLLTLNNLGGVRQAGLFQLISTLLKLLPLFLIAFVGIFYSHWSNLHDFNLTGKSNWSAISAAATLTLWSFVGLESATVPAESVVEPTRNIPRATILGTVLAAGIYIISTIAVMGIIGIHALQNSSAPYADAAKLIFGSWGGSLVAFGAVISCVGALNGWTLLSGQIPYAAAKDNLFPKLFAHETSRGTPGTGLVISSLLISILLSLTLSETLVKQFTLITMLATLASLIPYFFTAMAELLLLIKMKEKFNRRRFLISTTIAILAGIYAFWAMIGSGDDIVYYGALLFFSGIPVYVWMKWRA